MDAELAQRLTNLEEKVDKIYISVEKTRKYFFWTMVITIVLFVLPAVGLAFAVPMFMTNYIGPLQNLKNITCN